MEPIKIAKIAIFVLAGGYFIYSQFLKKKPVPEAPGGFYKLEDGNQSETKIAPVFDREKYDSIRSKYSWDNYDSFDNLFWEYMYMFYDPLHDLAVDCKDSQAFFQTLNREQKIFDTILSFTAQVDNGGVAQFFFNRPEYAYAMLQALKELGLDRFNDDYQKCYSEFMDAYGKFSKRRSDFGDSNLSEEEKWAAFTESYDDIKSAKALESYYFDDEFKTDFYKTMTDYIDANLDKFAKI